MSSITNRIDYTSRDYDGLRESLLEYAGDVIPEWKNRSEGDFGVALVELMAYAGDILSYYADRVEQESYLPTATQRQSILQIARLLGYVPSNGVAATGTVTLQTANPGPAVTVPAGTPLTTDYIDSVDGSLVYETTEEVVVPKNGGTRVVPVEHGQTQKKVFLQTSSGIPGQRIPLQHVSVLRDSITVYTDTVGPTNVVNPLEEWTQIDFLIDAGPNDKVFSTSVDSNGLTWIEFGDNLNGTFPNRGVNIYATYKVGGGVVGNVDAGQVVSLENGDLGASVFVAVDSAGKAMSSAMSGGADPESNDQIRVNAPRVFRTQNRMVTLQDYADAALAVPGVIRASAVAGSFSSISVYIVGPNGIAPSPVLIEKAQKALNDKALAGTTVTVAGPYFVPVNVGSSSAPLVVKVLDRSKKNTVQNEVDRAVKRLLSFEQVDFGMRLTVSDFYSAIMSVPGVQWVSIPMVARADSAQTGTADMAFLDWEIPILGAYYCEFIGGV